MRKPLLWGGFLVVANFRPDAIEREIEHCCDRGNRCECLGDGDLLTLDLAVKKDGIAADAAIRFILGSTRAPEDIAMIAATEEALAAAIAIAAPGIRLGDLSHEIESVLAGAGYLINMEYGGHGIGSTMHQDPHVANAGRPGRGYKLRPGLLLALEPWVMEDTDRLVTDPDDGWTLRSATGCRTAHSEHTIAITESSAEVLTLPSRGRQNA